MGFQFQRPAVVGNSSRQLCIKQTSIPFLPMTVKPLSVWIGFDPRAAAAFAVARESIRRFDRLIPTQGLVLSSHWTDGGPWLSHFRNVPYADEWFDILNKWAVR